MNAARNRPVRSRLSALLALAACAVLAACQTRTDVSATGNVSAQYQHVWLTMRQVEFNTSATAGPQDSGWQSFTLPAPQTIDLVSVTNGTLWQFASNLALPPGTYQQMRVVLADATEQLTSSAQSAAALYNDEVDYTDSSGTAHRVPLEIPNAAQGVGFAIDLTVQSADQAALAAFGCAAASASSGSGSLGTTGTFGTGLFGSSSTGCSSLLSSTSAAEQCSSGYTFDTTTGTCVLASNAIGTASAATGTTTTPTCAAGYTYDATTGTCVLASTSTSNPTNCSFGTTYNSTTGTCTSSFVNTAATTSTAIDFDASRDLAPYTVSGQAGFVLIPHWAEYDLSHAGTIQGQVSVAALPSGVGNIEVTAETLSSDSSRHVPVKSAPLRSDGSFVLYPLSTASGSPTQYDLVIHGAGIGTVIIKAVPVVTGSPSSASSAALTGIALAGASAFPVNVAPANPVSTRGAWIGFYQTLPASGEVPYLIEARPIDPFTGTFDSDQSLSAADLSYGTYASGSSLTLTAAAPTEGTATYHVAASAPLYGDGPLGTTVAPASSGGTATFTVATLSLPSGSTAASVAGTINVASPGRYDKGELVLTQNGAITAVVPLDAYLASAQSTATLFNNLPGGSAGSSYGYGLYYAEAWVWSSADPAGTLSRQPQSAAIDVSGGSASGVTISIE